MAPERGARGFKLLQLDRELFVSSLLALLFIHVSVVAAGACSFENGMCSDWVSTSCDRQACFQARKVADMEQGPTHDHTFMNGNGWSAYAMLEQPGNKTPVAQLTSTVVGPFCFTAWYHQSGTRDSRATFYAVTAGGTRKLLYTTQRDMAGEWQRVRYSEKRAAKIAISIRTFVERFPERGVFALDDLSVESGECALEKPSGSCDFDWGDTCGYNLGNGSEAWRLANGHEDPVYKEDYSTNTYNGGLVYMNARRNIQTAVLTSPELLGSERLHCLRFHYYMDHNNQPQEYSFSVTVEGTKSETVWTRSSKELSRGAWSAADVAFQEEKSFKIKFQCTIKGKKSTHSFCALDAIRLQGCSTKRATDNFCDFESGWCTWRNRIVFKNNSPWILGGGNTKTLLPRPSQDHTFGNATGSYLFFSNFEQNKGNRAELTGEILTWSSKITQCAEFWYVISEDPETSLQVQALDVYDPSDIYGMGIPLWEQTGGKSLEWKQGRIAVPHTRKVNFVGTTGDPSTPGFIALDDISILHHDRCETMPQDAEALPATELVSCSLAGWNFCHWSSVPPLPETWSFQSFSSSNLAPVTSPGNMKGNVAYLKGRSLNGNHGTALLNSPLVGPQPGLTCFSFWYHMFGGRSATLWLSVVKSPTSIGTQTSLPLLIQQGRTTADIWHNVRRTVKLDSVHNKLVFVISSGPSADSEVELSLGPLNLTSGKCDVLTDARGYCDFELDTCDWTIESGWQREQKSSAQSALDSSSGPVNSVYTLTATQSTDLSTDAVVSSPEWPGQNQPQCLEFWYSSAVVNSVHLQVEVVANGKSEVVWEQPQIVGKEWMLARVEILREKKFKVVFRATFLESGPTSISLDDVVLRPEPCRHLAHCAFTDGLCGYVNKFQRDLRWLVGTGRYENPKLQPALPRQEDSRPCAYLDLTTGRSDTTGQTYGTIPAAAKLVKLLSPLFDVPDDKSELLFRYYRSGPDITSANLSVSCFGNASNPKDPEAQFTRQLQRVLQWSVLNVGLKRGTRCQLTVLVTRGDGTNGTMAIASVDVKRMDAGIKPTKDVDSPVQCTFDDGTMCGWKSGNFPVKWVLNDYANKMPGFPRFDHTTKKYRGRFAFATHKDVEAQHAVLNSPDLDVNATGGACLSFWTFTAHAQHVNLDVRSGADRLFSTITRHSHQWDHVLVDFKRPEGKFKLQLSFYMEAGLVALDDISVYTGSCPQRDFCSWEVGSPCQVIPGPNSYDNWEVRRASHVGFPDHTTKNMNGRYLYLNTTEVHSHNPVSRVFMEKRPPTDATCITFWWSGYGISSRLNVYRFTTERALSNPLVSVGSHAQDGQWRARTVTVTSRTAWNLVFEGLAIGAFTAQSGIMVDDVEFAEGHCPPFEYCTFEDECLLWDVLKEDATPPRVAFEVVRAGSFNELPRDHTTQSEDGYYLLFKNTGTKGNSASLTLLDTNRYQCVHLWYYMPNLSDGVELYVQGERVPSSNSTWKHYQARLLTIWDDPISAVSGLNPKGFVAIDDISVSETACEELTHTNERFDCGNKTINIERVCDFVTDCDDGADEKDCGQCDFSESSCGWKNHSLSNMGPTSWRREAIGTVENSPQTGSDGRRHGQYLLLRTTGKKKNDYAAPAGLDSPVIRNTNKLCTLSFYYNYAFIDGQEMDVTLNMIASGYHFQVWDIDALSDKPEGKTWNKAVVEIGRYSQEISFYFISDQYPQSLSVFAVDDIRYNNCALPAQGNSCSDIDFHCSNGACVKKEEVCNYVDDCGDNSDEERCGDYRLSCNFESSFCDWTPQLSPDGKTKGNWRLAHPYDLLIHSPTRDHTTGLPEGKFLLFEATSKVEKAIIIGPTLDNSSYCAVTFFFAMQGTTRPQLSLAIRSTKDGRWKTVWKQSRPSNILHFVGISKELKSAAPYQVAFIGEHRTSDAYGYIAVDDVHFWETCSATDKELPAERASTVLPFMCGENEFQCGELNECIQKSQLCDFKADCSNGVDESRCGFCEFTTDLCGLVNRDASARYGWNWTTALVGRRNKDFPSTDSRMNEHGAYAVYALLNPEAPEGTTTALVTPKMGEVAHSCIISVYAYIPSKRGAQLNFGVQYRLADRTRRNALRTLATLSAAEGAGKWVKIQVKTGNWKAGVRFLYTANSIGVSIDSPEYKMCHPDTQSQGWEAALHVSCGFSDFMNCGWFPENLEDDTEWLLHTEDPGYPGLPWRPPYSEPHKGAYLYSVNTAPRVSTARVVSVRMSPTPDTGHCFSFWYNIWHPNIGTLKLLRRVDNASTDLLWMRQSPQGKDWKQGWIQLHSEDPHQLVFEALLNRGTPGVIAVDDFVLKDGRCDHETYGTCDFESDTCGWQLHNWERVTSQRVTLPATDHSTRSPSGYFTLAKAPGGRMVSPLKWYDATKHRCLRFWFFISGTSSERLNVTSVVDEDQEKSLWYGTASQASIRQWFSASVNLPAQEKTPMIVFDAATSDNPGSAAAVDDISLGHTPCPPPGSCSFDEDTCNWYNAGELTNAQWYRHRGATVSNLTGVQLDHTLGSKDGYYLLLDAEDTSARSLGSMQSEALTLGPAVCFRLYYVMRQNSGASLSVGFLDEHQYLDGRATTVKATTPSQWTLLQVERTELPPVFTIIITGRTEQGSSDIAIDDIDVRSGRCATAEPDPEASMPPTTNADSPATSHVTEPMPSKQPAPPEVVTWKSKTTEAPATSEPLPSVVCKRGEFKCRTENTCIPGSLLCDGVYDCLDGLDEKCGSGAQCKENEFFCVTRTPSACLPRSLLCDDQEDCVGGSDEALCGACPAYFCQNGGTCRWTALSRSPRCECPQAYKGVRCQTTAEINALENKLTAKASGSAGAVATGVIVVFAIVIIGVVAAIVIMRKRRMARKSPVYIDNPSYDASTDEIRLVN